MNKAETLANLLHEQLTAHFDRVEISGQVRRRATEVDTVQLLLQTADPVSAMLTLQNLTDLEQNDMESSPFAWRGQMTGFDVRVELLLFPAEQMDRQLFIHTAADAHLQQVGAGGASLLQTAYLTTADAGTETETLIYAQAGLSYVVPEMREDEFRISLGRAAPAR